MGAYQYGQVTKVHVHRLDRSEISYLQFIHIVVYCATNTIISQKYNISITPPRKAIKYYYFFIPLLFQAYQNICITTLLSQVTTIAVLIAVLHHFFKIILAFHSCESKKTVAKVILLPPTTYWLVTILFELYPRMKIACGLVCALRNIFNKKQSKKNAKIALDKWGRNAGRNLVHELISVRDSIKGKK